MSELPSLSDIVQTLVVWAPGVILAITLHEWAHGFAADRFGDPTPRALGRLTLNPLAHIDWVWTVLVPGALLIFAGFAFGGAKPVPVNPRYFRRPFRLALFSVAIAGPLMNLVLATLCVLLFRAVVTLPDFFAIPLMEMLRAAIVMNVLLAVFNMLPLPPLDGGRVAVALLPAPLDRHLARLEPHGLIILVLLMVSDVLDVVLRPAMQAVFLLLNQLAS
ncbi:MAG: site-2 protease family protein [Magnetococcus sp. WYHC-3]